MCRLPLALVRMSREGQPHGGRGGGWRGRGWRGRGRGRNDLQQFHWRPTSYPQVPSAQQSHVTGHMTPHPPGSRQVSPRGRGHGHSHNFTQPGNFHQPPMTSHPPGPRQVSPRGYHNFTPPGSFHQPPAMGAVYRPPPQPYPGLLGCGGPAVSGYPALFPAPPHPPSHSHHYHTRPPPHPPSHTRPPNHTTSHSPRYKVERPWVRVSQPLCGRRSQPVILSVMTYNILSQNLIDQNMHLYRKCAAANLDWESRRQLLLREISEASADVVCLQEVEEEHYHGWFSPRLSELGYSGVYKKRTGEHSDGCAVFYTTSRLKVLEWKEVEFQRGVQILDRDNVGIVIKFQITHHKMRGCPIFCVGTTHLLFNPRAGEVKLAQLACLLAELDQMASAPGSPSLPCILCGDLNSLPLSPLLQFIETGQLDYSQLTAHQVAGYFNERSEHRPIPVPLLPPTVPIGQDCRYISAVTKAQEDTASAPSGSAHEAGPTAPSPVLSHPFSFTSTYPRPSTGNPPSTVTTYHTSAFETVDYIHYTPADSPSPPTHTGPAAPGGRNKQVTTPSSPSGSGGASRGKGGFRLLSRRALPSTHTLLGLGPQPHHLLPSDHLWLLASFQLIPA